MTQPWIRVPRHATLRVSPPPPPAAVSRCAGRIPRPRVVPPALPGRGLDGSESSPVTVRGRTENTSYTYTATASGPDRISASDSQTVNTGTCSVVTNPRRRRGTSKRPRARRHRSIFVGGGERRDELRNAIPRNRRELGGLGGRRPGHGAFGERPGGRHGVCVRDSDREGESPVRGGVRHRAHRGGGSADGLHGDGGVGVGGGSGVGRLCRGGQLHVPLEHGRDELDRGVRGFGNELRS